MNVAVRRLRERALDSMPAAWLLIAAPPLAFAVWYVQGFALDVPLLDQVDLLPLFGRIASGEVRLADFFAPHHDVHVPVVPRIVFAATAFATDLNFRAEVYAGFAVALFTVWLLHRTFACGSAEPGGPAGARIASVFAVCLLFAPAYHDAWTWSIGLAHFLENACIVGAVYQLARPQPRLATAMLLCVVVSFCRVEGLLSWVALLPVYLPAIRRAGKPCTYAAIWAGVAAACWAVTITSILSGIPHALNAAQAEAGSGDSLVGRLLFIPSLVGDAPASFLRQLLPDVPLTHAFFPGGAVILVAFFGLSLRLWIAHESRLRAAPWVSLGGFALALPVATAIGGGWPARQWGRSPGGLRLWPMELYMSAFATTGALVTIATIFLLVLFCSTRTRVLGLSLAAFGRVAVALGALFVLLNYVSSLPQILDRRLDGQWDADCVELVQYLVQDNTCKASPDLALRLEKARLRTMRRDVKFDEAGPAPGKIVGHEWVTPRPRGSLPSAIVWGTVLLPDLSAGTVLLAFGDDRRFFAKATRVYRRGSETIWKAVVPSHVFRQEEGPIRAWLYERQQGRFRRLDRVVLP